MKVDVSIQSYNKPESLIYALFCLHKCSKEHINTVWINDDQSEEGVVEKYLDLDNSGSLSPWKIKVRKNTKRMGWWLAFVRGYRPAYQTNFFRFKRMIWNIWKTGRAFSERQDIRYQWALDSTSAKYLFVMHDDIYFQQNIVGLYLDAIVKKKLNSDDPIAVVGDLGQCWRCKHEQFCTPKSILQGKRPDKEWPLTQKKGEKHKWACRINEWSCLIDVNASRTLIEREKVFFGNYEDDGDVAAYWFSRMLANGYSFTDPLPEKKDRDNYYIHWEDGVTGHSSWVDQGRGLNKYTPELFTEKLKLEFSYNVKK